MAAALMVAVAAQLCELLRAAGLSFKPAL